MEETQAFALPASLQVECGSFWVISVQCREERLSLNSGSVASSSETSLSLSFLSCSRGP